MAIWSEIGSTTIGHTQVMAEQLPSGLPDRVLVHGGVVRQADHPAPQEVHDVELPVPSPLRHEGQVAAIGRPGRVPIAGRVARQVGRLAATAFLKGIGDLQGIDLPVAIPIRLEGDPLAIEGAAGRS